MVGTLVREGESASRHRVVMESASGIKETGEQSTVVTSPMKPCEGCGKPTRIKCSNYKCFINWSESQV